jgi:hypothetical protein
MIANKKKKERVAYNAKVDIGLIELTLATGSYFYWSVWGDLNQPLGVIDQINPHLPTINSCIASDPFL